MSARKINLVKLIKNIKLVTTFYTSAPCCLRENFRSSPVVINLALVITTKTLLVYDKGGCCAYQKETFRTNGLQRGMTPAEYMQQLSNFSSHNRQLNFVRVQLHNFCSDVRIKRNIYAWVFFIHSIVFRCFN